MFISGESPFVFGSCSSNHQSKIYNQKSSTPPLILRIVSRYFSCAASTLTSRKRTSSLPGVHCASSGMSAFVTHAIFGYPPVVALSAIITIGCPSAGTWIDPIAIPSDVSSARLFRSSRGPCNRYPIRSDAPLTQYVPDRNLLTFSSSN